MAKVTFNGNEFNISTAAGCAKAINFLQENLNRLEEQYQILESEINPDLEVSGRNINLDESDDKFHEIEKFKNKIVQHHRWLEVLSKKHGEILEKEDVDAARALLDQAEKRAASLAKYAEREIPALSRKLTVLAATLEKEASEREYAEKRAREAGIENYSISSPMQRIVGPGLHKWSPAWWKNLRLPFLDEDMEVLSYWPFSKISKARRDNPNIQDQVETILTADDPAKALKAVYREIDKMDVFIRIKDTDRPLKSVYRPEWYERPSTEWPELLKGNSVTAALHNLGDGDHVQFWLNIDDEQRRLNAFVNLLGRRSGQRESALAHLPEAERQKYWDYLDAYQENMPAPEQESRLEKFKSNAAEYDDSDDEPGSLEAVG